MVKKLYVLMNCILNMNTRAPGIAIHRGPVEPIANKLIEKDLDIIQIPCPETTFIGLKRWWFTKELYDSVPYRQHCRKLARAVAEIIRRYHENGYVIIFVGLSMSPSCGVLYTQSDDRWEGKPFDVGLAPPLSRGKGVFVEELEKAMNETGIPLIMYEVPPSVIYPRFRVPELPEHPSDQSEGLASLMKIFED